jgi:methyl-accepting chemotaxis protein
MKAITYFKEHLWVQILSVLCLVISLVILSLIFLSIHHQNKALAKNANYKSRILFEAIEGSMISFLEIGDNDAVTKHFVNLKNKIPELDIAIYNTDLNVVFSSNPDLIGESVAEFLHEKSFIQVLKKIVKKMTLESKYFNEEVNNITYINVCRPILNEKRCHDCHDSSKKVLGATILRRYSDKDNMVISEARNRSIFFGFGGIVITILLIFFMLNQMVNKPLIPLSKSIAWLRNGDFAHKIEFKGRTEISHMCSRMNLVTDYLRGLIREIVIFTNEVLNESKKILDLSGEMSSQSDHTSEKANTVSVSSDTMSSSMNSIAVSVEQATTNLDLIANATGEMTSTINEISQNTEKAKLITSEAVTEADNASLNVNELGTAAEKIGKVTETITEISAQTNLLALNATIEAARAGEAGKGFSVVANEIKDLANQTSSATDEIRDRILAIQNSTEITVSQINQISKVVNQVSEIVSAVATAVDEQSVTTKEIASNVKQASLGMREVNKNISQSSNFSTEIAKDISEVNQASGGISKSSSDLNICAVELSKLAEKLKNSVGKFKI